MAFATLSLVHLWNANQSLDEIQFYIISTHTIFIDPFNYSELCQFGQFKCLFRVYVEKFLAFPFELRLKLKLGPINVATLFVCLLIFP